MQFPIKKPTFKQYILGYLANLCGDFCKLKKSNRTLRQISDSEKQINRHLDLQKFLIRQRRLNTAIICLLSSNQTRMVEYMSSLLLEGKSFHFDSDSYDNESCSSQDINGKVDSKFDFIDELNLSEDKLDKRLLRFQLARKNLFVRDGNSKSYNHLEMTLKQIEDK